MHGIDFQGQSEEELIIGLRKGKQTALAGLYKAYAPVLLGVISRIVPNPDVAEEVLKDTFVAIWDRRMIFNPENSRFLTWCLALARGIALEAVKTEKFTPPTAAQANEPELTKGNHVPQTPPLDQSVFCQLRPEERTILELMYLQGRSCPEVAAQLQLTEQEVKTRLKKAFSQLGVTKTA